MYDNNTHGCAINGYRGYHMDVSKQAVFGYVIISKMAVSASRTNVAINRNPSVGCINQCFIQKTEAVSASGMARVFVAHGCA